MNIPAETTAEKIKFQLDGKEYIGNLTEKPLFSDRITDLFSDRITAMGENDFLGYICIIEVKNPMEQFIGFKKVNFLKFSASFYCGETGLLIEESLHLNSIFETMN